jgi:hypothetical protein
MTSNCTFGLMTLLWCMKWRYGGCPAERERNGTTIKIFLITICNRCWDFPERDMKQSHWFGHDSLLRRSREKFVTIIWVGCKASLHIWITLIQKSKKTIKHCSSRQDTQNRTPEVQWRPSRPTSVLNENRSLRVVCPPALAMLTESMTSEWGNSHREQESLTIGAEVVLMTFADIIGNIYFAKEQPLSSLPIWAIWDGQFGAGSGILSPEDCSFHRSDESLDV